MMLDPGDFNGKVWYSQPVDLVAKSVVSPSILCQSTSKTNYLRSVVQGENMSRNEFNVLDDDDVNILCNEGVILGIERKPPYTIFNIAVPGQFLVFRCVDMYRSRIEKKFGEEETILVTRTGKIVKVGSTIDGIIILEVQVKGGEEFYFHCDQLQRSFNATNEDVQYAKRRTGRDKDGLDNDSLVRPWSVPVQPFV